MTTCTPHNCIFIECDSQWTSIGIDNATTVDGVTTVNLSTIALPNNSSMHITSRINAVRRGGSAGVAGETWIYTIITRAKNIGGVITVSAPVVTSFLDTLEPTVTYTSSGSNVLIDLIGAANKTIFWVVKNEMVIVSHSAS